MIESLLLTADQKMFRQVIRDWCQKEWLPRREEYLRAGPKEWPWEDVILRQMGNLGVLGLRIPEEYGGTGGGTVDQVILFEEGGRYQVPFPLTSISATCKNLAEFGSEDLKREWLPRLARGEMLGAYAQSEPDAGSDAPAMTTTAVLDGDEWVINGTKRWITNAEYAGVFFVVAKTDPSKRGDGIGAFWVERDRPGLTVGKLEELIGWRLAPSNTLYFENCRVPRDHLVFKEGGAFRRLMHEFNGERCGNSAFCLGYAEAAFEMALQYSQEREAFGQPIGNFQGIQWMLADMSVQIEAARHLIYHAAYNMDQGKNVAREAATAKLYTNEMVRRVCDDAIQIHGANGVSCEYRVESLWRDGRVLNFGGGTPQILRSRIANELMKRKD
ncbi:MAG: acyl-CoA dehydrogenase [Chloroflexota bacterium]|nr:MAG: acyl-CoA dehydrogenase [Chloroflexota bacterium]